MEELDKLTRFAEMLAYCPDKAKRACELIVQEFRPGTATREWDDAGEFAQLCFELAQRALQEQDTE